MSYLTINGQAIPVASAERKDATLRDTGRNVTGAWRNRQVGDRKEAWSIQTALMPLTEARALACLLEGQGDHWTADTTDGVYSDLGNPATDVTVGGSGKFGERFLCGVTFGGVVSVGVSPVWSVSVWVKDGGTWHHRVQTSAGTKWEDGVQGSYAWSYGVDSSGLVFFGVGLEIDDVLVLPCVLPDTWVSNWDVSAAYPARPHVSVGGDIIEGAARFYDAGGSVVLREPPGRAVHQRATLSFMLEEV